MPIACDWNIRIRVCAVCRAKTLRVCFPLSTLTLPPNAMQHVQIMHMLPVTERRSHLIEVISNLPQGNLAFGAINLAAVFIGVVLRPHL